MPQNPKFSQKWQDELGNEWECIQKTWLHTLGNLTLTGYNSVCSDRPFSEKRDIEGGFRSSPLRVNEGLGQTVLWNEDSIQTRARLLAIKALDVWKAPSLSDEIMNNYLPSTERELSTYSIKDHKHLQEGKTLELFLTLRREVMMLDPCVTEEFLKLYVAFKAETNFVDVIPLANSLKFSINMRFSEISDLKGICKDTVISITG